MYKTIKYRYFIKYGERFTAKTKEEAAQQAEYSDLVQGTYNAELLGNKWLIEQCVEEHFYYTETHDIKEDAVFLDVYIIVFNNKTGELIGQCKFNVEITIPEPEIEVELLEVIEL